MESALTNPEGQVLSSQETANSQHSVSCDLAPGFLLVCGERKPAGVNWSFTISRHDVTVLECQTTRHRGESVLKNKGRVKHGGAFL